jgi:hypothetical protein
MLAYAHRTVKTNGFVSNHLKTQSSEESVDINLSLLLSTLHDFQ